MVRTVKSLACSFEGMCLVETLVKGSLRLSFQPIALSINDLVVVVLQTLVKVEPVVRTLEGYLSKLASFAMRKTEVDESLLVRMEISEEGVL